MRHDDGYRHLDARLERRAPRRARPPRTLRLTAFREMKLYFSPGACSLSPHIALCEAGLAFQAVPVNIRTHALADNTDYYTIHLKGYVPVLEFDDGARLSEGPAILQWIADQVPDKQLAPAATTLDRYRLQEWLNFISTEIHKQFSPLFNPAMPENAKALFRHKVLDRLTYVDHHLADREYLLGTRFSVADAYLYTVTRWAAHLSLDISDLAHLVTFMARMDARPAVQMALKAEGLRP
jgi:glutathione S-transferase